MKGVQYKHHSLVEKIYRRLGGVGAIVDAVLVALRQVERYRDTRYLVIKPAARKSSYEPW